MNILLFVFSWGFIGFCYLFSPSPSTECIILRKLFVSFLVFKTSRCVFSPLTSACIYVYTWL